MLQTRDRRSCSEEIAFYKGAEVEKRRIMETFQIMLKQIMKVLLPRPQPPPLHLTPAARFPPQVASVRAPYQVLEGFLMKCLSPPLLPSFPEPPLTICGRYTWSSAGLIMVALPSFYSKAADDEADTTSGRTQNFVSPICDTRVCLVMRDVYLTRN
jgi:hypothetical protein